MEIKFLYDNIERFNGNVGRLIGKGVNNYIWSWATEIYCLLKFGCSPDDFFRYEFYKKSDYERRKFITYRKSQYIIRRFNSSDYRSVLDDKARFNEYFSDFVNRDWIDLRVVGRSDFEEFLCRHKSVIIKPIKGGQGIGIVKITQDSYQLSDFENYRKCIAEEVLQQAKEVEELNPSSVNTIRVQTFYGKPIAAAIRIGNGNSVVDNLHSDGICGHIDLNCGVVDAPCINNRYDKFINHPLTNAQLVGFKIPNWSGVIKVVEDAARRIPEVRYVGWDVAVLDNGKIALIEGNYDPGHDVIQMIVQSGLWNSIVKLNSKQE